MKLTATTTAQAVFAATTEQAGAVICQNLDATNGIWVSMGGTATSTPSDATLDPGFDSFYIPPGQSLVIDDTGLNRRIGGRISVVAAAATAVCNFCRLK